MSSVKPTSWSSDLEWSPVPASERAALIEQLSPIDGKYRVTSNTTMEATHLPFYSDSVRLLRLLDSHWITSPQVHYLQYADSLFRLNGTSPPIHEINAKAPIQLDDANILGYLRFFCYFVHGDEGPFLIFESTDLPEVPSIPDADTKSLLEENAYPARFNGKSSDGHFMATAMIWYSNAVFAARFDISSTGMIEMIDDEPVFADLPCKPDVRLS